MSAPLLILLGGMLGIGFLGSVLFERTGIPDVLFLVGIGIAVGPLSGIVAPETVRPFMASFGSVALTIILFEGGLELDLKNTFRQVGRALALALFSFGSALFLVHYALVIGLNAAGATAWAAAAAFSCTGVPLIVPMLARLAPESSARPLLTVESAVSGSLAIIAVLGIGAFGGDGLAGVAFWGRFGRSLLVGGAISVAAGLLWLWMPSRLFNRRFFYLMTVGVVFLLMGGVEALRGSGAFAVFIFGAILGNGGKILRIFPARLRDRLGLLFSDGDVSLHRRITEAHSEITFLIRSFFFVCLGVVLRLPLSDPRMWLAVLIVLVAVVVGREIAVQLAGWTTGIPARDRTTLGAVVPRDLAAAVLASAIASRSGEGAPSWETLAVFIVLATNLWTAVRLMKSAAPSAKREA